MNGEGDGQRVELGYGRVGQDDAVLRRRLALLVGVVAVPFWVDGVANVLQAVVSLYRDGGNPFDWEAIILCHGLSYGVNALSATLALVSGVSLWRSGRDRWRTLLFAALIGLTVGAVLNTAVGVVSARNVVSGGLLDPWFTVSFAITLVAPSLAYVLLFLGLALIYRPRR